MNAEQRGHLIRDGKDLKVYEYLGSHLATKGGKSGAYFRVYAPNAKEIFVTASLFVK